MKAWMSKYGPAIADVLVAVGSIGSAMKGEISWETAVGLILLKLLPSASGDLLRVLGLKK